MQLRVLRWFVRRGLLDPATAADMRTWRGTGGFSVDGSVRIEGEDRAGLERLIRYCARGPLALERLHAPAGIGALSSADARLVYRLPEPDLHGRQALRLTPLELLQRLARLVPPSTNASRRCPPPGEPEPPPYLAFPFSEDVWISYPSGKGGSVRGMEAMQQRL